MPRDSNGNTSPLPGTIVTSGETILPSQHNPAMQDIYAMLTQSLSRDGQGGMRAPLNMNGSRIMNVGAAVLPGDAISLSQFQSGTPVGAVVDYAGDAPPEKWMMCYGQAISRTAYPDAFAACGVKFGSGDGTTTFNLPDYRGRVGVGKDDMGGSDAARMTVFGVLAKTIGGIFGSASHVLTWGQMPKFRIGGIPTNVTINASGWGVRGGAPSSNVSIEYGRMVTGSGQNEAGGETLESLRSSGNDQVASLWGSRESNEVGNNDPHNNTQPSIVMNKIIKVLY